MKKWLFVLIAFGMTITETITPVLANHGDRYSATGCVPMDSKSVYTRVLGNLQASGAGRVYVECQIIRKGNLSTPTNHYIQVRVFDTSVTDSVSCTLISFINNVFQTTNANSGYSFTGLKTLYISLNNIQNWDEALSLFCVIPGGSGPGGYSSISDYYHYSN